MPLGAALVEVVEELLGAGDIAAADGIGNRLKRGGALRVVCLFAAFRESLFVDKLIRPYLCVCCHGKAYYLLQYGKARGFSHMFLDAGVRTNPKATENCAPQAYEKRNCGGKVAFPGLATSVVLIY